MTTAEMQPITDWHRPLRDADFYTARSVDEALRLASEHAGALHRRWHHPGADGTLGRQRPAGPRLHRPDRGAEGGPRAGRANPVGSLATHNRFRTAVGLGDRAAALLDAAQEIAGPAVRNLATIGGNVYGNWDLVPPLLALEARVHVRGQGGEAVIPLAAFYDAQASRRSNRPT